MRLTSWRDAIAYEIHPGEDVHDGVSFEMFLERVGNHPRANLIYDPRHLVLQCIDYLAFIDIYRERIKCFHVKDAKLDILRPDRSRKPVDAVSYVSYQ